MNRSRDRRSTTIKPVFVETIPADAGHLEAGKLYISMKYNTLIHRCPCGCGGLSEIGLHPATRQMTYDGETVSIRPSIGVRTLPCRSHYWISKNRVVWADSLDDESDVPLDRYREDLTRTFVRRQEVDAKSWLPRLIRKVLSYFRK